MKDILRNIPIAMLSYDSADSVVSYSPFFCSILRRQKEVKQQRRGEIRYSSTLGAAWVQFRLWNKQERKAKKEKAETSREQSLAYMVNKFTPRSVCDRLRALLDLQKHLKSQRQLIHVLCAYG